MMQRIVQQAGARLHNSVFQQTCLQCLHHQQQQQIHASATLRNAEDSSSSSTAAADQEAPSTSQPSEAAAAAGPSGRPPHIPLDHPDVNRYLQYNTEFKTDEARMYKIGMRQSLQKSRDASLRQALAAHRLELRDAQLAAGRPPAPLQDQMAERLAQMEAAVRGV